MHIRVLKQELDHSEQQKLTQFQHMQQLEKYGARLRDGLNNLIAMIQERPECL